MIVKIFSEWSFFIFTFTFSWLFWLIAILIKKNFMQFPTVIFYALGGMGPCCISLILLYLNKSADKSTFWNRFYSFKRVGGLWFGIIFLVTISATLIAIGAAYIFGNKANHFSNVKAFFTNPALVGTTLTLNIVAVTFEEVGWRGYALPRLEQRFSALVAAIILGIIWSLWHLPLFFIRGSYQANLQFNSLRFWMFVTAFFSQSILITWVFNNTGQSILAAICFHLSVNLLGEIFKLDDQTELIRFVIFNVYAILILILWSPKTLAKPLWIKDGTRN